MHRKSNLVVQGQEHRAAGGLRMRRMRGIMEQFLSKAKLILMLLKIAILNSMINTTNSQIKIWKKLFPNMESR